MQYHPAPPIITIPEADSYKGEADWSYTLQDGSGWVISVSSPSSNESDLLRDVSVTADIPDLGKENLFFSSTFGEAKTKEAIFDILGGIQRMRLLLLAKMESHESEDKEFYEYMTSLIRIYTDSLSAARKSLLATFHAEEFFDDKLCNHVWEFGDGSGMLLQVSNGGLGGIFIRIGLPSDHNGKLFLYPALFTKWIKPDDDLADILFNDVLNRLGEIRKSGNDELESAKDSARLAIQEAEERYADASVELAVNQFLSKSL